MMIRELIHADHDARKEVEEVEAQRSQTRALIEAQKTEIFQRHNEEANNRLQAHMQHLENELEEAKQKKDEEYTILLAQLQENFHNKKDGWVQDIVERCLKG